MTAIVGDIGGTHARLALVHGGTLHHETKLRNDDHATLLGLIQGWLAPLGVRPTRAALAIAGPIDGDTVTFTNRPWTFSCTAMTEALGVERLVVLNDFEAIAHAVAALPEGAVRHLSGPTAGLPGAPRVVIGPGTGLGVACIVPVGDGWQPVSTEGGHASLAACSADERVLRDLLAPAGRLHAEHVLSGPGLVHLHDAIRKRDGQPPRVRSPEDITAAALTGDDAACEETVQRFVQWLARFAGDVALVHGARGGVFLAGGILTDLTPWLTAPATRAAFDDKASQAAYIQRVPLYQITDPNPALFGCASALGLTGLTR